VPSHAALRLHGTAKGFQKPLLNLPTNNSFADLFLSKLLVGTPPVLRLPGTIISASGMAGVGWEPAIPGGARERRLCPMSRRRLSTKSSLSGTDI